MKEIARVFQELDSSQNGVIWRQDFRTIMPKFSPILAQLSEDDFDDLFDLLDLDGDGYI